MSIQQWYAPKLPPIRVTYDATDTFSIVSTVLFKMSYTILTKMTNANRKGNKLVESFSFEVFMEETVEFPNEISLCRFLTIGVIADSFKTCGLTMASRLFRTPFKIDQLLVLLPERSFVKVAILWLAFAIVVTLQIFSMTTIGRSGARMTGMEIVMHRNKTVFRARNLSANIPIEVTAIDGTIMAESDVNPMSLELKPSCLK